MIWTRRAVADLDRLRQFLIGNSPAAAARAIETIHARAQMLDQYLAAGRPIDGLPFDARELIVEFGDGGYVLLYRVVGDTAYILAVRHMREAGY